MGGAGIAALGAAAGFGIEGLLAKNELNRLCAGQISCKGHSQSELDPLNSRKDIGLGVLIGAGVLGVAGVTAALVQIVGKRQMPAKAAGALSVAPAFGPGLGGVALGGRFR
jgi:hypothetical protein